MSNQSLPRSAFRGPVRLGEVTIEGHVLDDGRRVFSARDLVRALSDEGGPKNAHFRRHLAVFTNHSDGLKVGPKIEFTAPGGTHHGYPIETLVAVCDAYVDGLISGTLHPKQEPAARRARLLQRAWSTVGLVALVDEATGYQAHRGSTALQDHLALLLREAPGPYQPLFSNTFFNELFRLHRVPPRAHGLRPRRFAKFLAKYFYRWLSPAAYVELDHRVPANDSGRRPAKLHTHLTDGARALFERHQDTVIALMRTSANLRDFDTRFGVAFRGHALQLPLTA